MPYNCCLFVLSANTLRYPLACSVLLTFRIYPTRDTGLYLFLKLLVVLRIRRIESTLGNKKNTKKKNLNVTEMGLIAGR